MKRSAFVKGASRQSCSDSTFPLPKKRAKTTTGRYIYAVGGNREAARLSGVPVKFVLFFVYTITALLAGFGGIITASQLKSGSPTYGLSYEMFAIASVVVGGTSLAGGEGKIFGTLIGSFIIAIIQNGMNLLGVESYTQKVVLGLVILVGPEKPHQARPRRILPRRCPCSIRRKMAI